MKIHEMFKAQKPVISFEVFPPKRDGNVNSIYKTIDELAKLSPDYISVTYGAAGTERGNETLNIAAKIKNEYKIESLAHLTCVNATRDEIKSILDIFESNQIENILALRGDYNLTNQSENVDFKYASDLVRFVKENKTFGIGAACYPEGHIEARSKTTDLIYLKEKVNAGVDFLVTQLFFDNDQFYNFRHEARSLDINIPMTVGIMPVLNRKQIERMVQLSGAFLPDKFKKILNRYEFQPQALQDAGIAYASEQIIDLLSSGVDGVHLYVMNKPEVAKRLIDNISSIVKAI